MKKLSFLGVFLLLSACVTINIYFPAAAAEKAADKIIKGIQSISPETPEKIEPEAKQPNWQLTLYQGVDNLLNVIISPAHAAANLSIDSPDIRRLRASMKARFGSLRGFYSKGYVGIKKDSYIVVRNAGKIPLKSRNKVKKLVGAENADRRKLYQAIANANGHPDWFAQIQSTFAKRWVSNAKAGWWVQAPNGKWKQK